MFWKKTRKSLFDNAVGNDFIDLTQVQRTKVKINKWDYIKLKTFYTAKETIQNKWKGNLWDLIFSNHISDKGLMSKT